MSLLHFLFYCRSGGTLDRLVAIHGGAQESRLVGGSQRLALAARRPAGRRCTARRPGHGHPPGRWGRGGDPRRRGVVKAGRAIVALPPTLAGRIRYSPALPPLRDQLTQQVPMGYVIKVQIAYPEPFWRADGLSGSVFSLDDEVSVIFDNSPQDLSCGVLLGFLEGRHGRRAGKLPPEERKELILSVFARFFGSRAADPQEYVERDWAAEEWSRGCYGGRFGTGVWTGYGEALREPWAVSTGLARRQRRSGTATWTERYAPASAPPAKCSSLKNHSAWYMRKDHPRHVLRRHSRSFTGVRGR